MNDMTQLSAGTVVLAADGTAHTVTDVVANAFQPGDRVVANAIGGLLHIPAADHRVAHDAVVAAARAFDVLQAVPDASIEAFFHGAADALGDDAVWQQIATVNQVDVERAQAKGRSMTRLAVSDSMREKMIEGLRGWAATPSSRGSVVETIEHDDFDIEMVAAGLGVVGFVFEGRPNVLADACGVLRSGNSVVFRIGSDALETAKTIMARAIRPALARAGLSPDTVLLLDSSSHAAGWALFLEADLALAVARGSGFATDLLGSLAKSVGTPVSLHGTGGAWIVVSASASGDEIERAVVRSLDRKVCNTLNTLALLDPTPERVGRVIDALQKAGDRRSAPFKLHVTEEIETVIPAQCRNRTVTIARAEGDREEPQVERIADDQLGNEWEWEESPEITFTSARNLDEAVQLFNAQSPRLVATLLSPHSSEHDRFFESVDAPFVGDDHTRWVDGQFALGKPELGLSNWENGRLFGRGGVLTGDSVYTLRTRYRAKR